MTNSESGSVDEPILIGDYWVLASLDDVVNGQVQLHVSIAVPTSDEITGSDLSVQLTAGSQDLTANSRPDPDSPLPVVESRGSTAIGQYTFDNPESLSPTTITVTLRDAIGVFDFGPPLVA